MEEIMKYFKRKSASKEDYLLRLEIEYNTRVDEYIDVRNKYSEVEESLILHYIGQLEDEIERVKSNN